MQHVQQGLPRSGFPVDEGHGACLSARRRPGPVAAVPRPALRACIVVAGLACMQAMAPVLAQTAAPALPQAPAPTSSESDVLNTTRQSARFTAEWLARGVDSWFGDKPFSDGGEVSDGRMSLGVLKRPDEGTSVSLRFNARFRLPNLQEKSYFFIGRDNPREVITDKPGAFTRQQRLVSENDKDNKFFAGLGVALRETVDLRLGVRGGLKPYLQARYKKPWQWSDADRVEFRQTLFWTVDDHVGSTTALSYEHAVSRTLAYRWLTAATVTQESRRLEWTSSLGAYKAFGAQRLLALETLVTGAQHTGVGLTDYGVQARWEQPLHRDWLLGELIVGHFWPRADASVAREGGWALGGTLKMRF